MRQTDVMPSLTGNLHPLPSIKPLMSLLLTPGFFFGLKLGKCRPYRPAGCSPTVGRASQENKETLVSTEMLGNTGWGMECCRGCPLACGA